MHGWSMIKRKGARRGGDWEVEIVFARGNSAVAVVVGEVGGVDIGGEEAEMIGGGDVVGFEMICGFDDVGLIVPVTTKDAVPV